MRKTVEYAKELALLDSIIMVTVIVELIIFAQENVKSLKIVKKRDINAKRYMVTSVSIDVVKEIINALYHVQLKGVIINASKRLTMMRTFYINVVIHTLVNKNVEIQSASEPANMISFRFMKNTNAMRNNVFINVNFVIGDAYILIIFMIE